MLGDFPGISRFSTGTTELSRSSGDVDDLAEVAVGVDVGGFDGVTQRVGGGFAAELGFDEGGFGVAELMGMPRRDAGSTAGAADGLAVGGGGVAAARAARPKAMSSRWSIGLLHPSMRIWRSSRIGATWNHTRSSTWRSTTGWIEPIWPDWRRR